MSGELFKGPHDNPMFNQTPVFQDTLKAGSGIKKPESQSTRPSKDTPKSLGKSALPLRLGEWGPEAGVRNKSVEPPTPEGLNYSS